MDEKPNNIKQLILASSAYAGSSILGPLAVFGGLGYFLDKTFGTGHKFLFLSIAVAFITTNYLLYKKTKKIMFLMEKLSEEDKKKTKSDKTPINK